MTSLSRVRPVTVPCASPYHLLQRGWQPKLRRKISEVVREEPRATVHGASAEPRGERRSTRRCPPITSGISSGARKGDRIHGGVRGEGRRRPIPVRPAPAFD